jgi:hypothetical protein
VAHLRCSQWWGSLRLWANGMTAVSAFYLCENCMRLTPSGACGCENPEPFGPGRFVAGPATASEFIVDIADNEDVQAKLIEAAQFRDAAHLRSMEAERELRKWGAVVHRLEDIVAYSKGLSRGWRRKAALNNRSTRDTAGATPRISS